MPTISHQYTSPNHSSRNGARIRMLLLHATVGSLKSALAWLCNPQPNNPKDRVSSHFVIAKDGRIFQLVPISEAAWHAGTAIWRGETDVNAISISIELENSNSGSDPYPALQRYSLHWLCQDLLATHHLTPAEIATHAQVALPAKRKTDPAGFDLPAFVASLTSPAPTRSALPLHGMVLTNVSSRDRLEDKIVAGHHTILKIIPSWGLDTAWTDARRAWACALTSHTLIRTHAGDPSAHHPYLHTDEVLAELTPWYGIRRHNLYIELGNEPNSDASVDPSGYAWHLTKAISACRQAFPRAKLISPALLLDRGNPARWLSNPDFAAACAQCDLLGVHVYAHVNFDDTGQLAQAQALYAQSSQPRALTEYGIHDPQTPDATKGQRYAAFVRSLPDTYAIATYYHTDDLATVGINAAYALDLSGDVAYGTALETR